MTWMIKNKVTKSKDLRILMPGIQILEKTFD